MEITSLVLQCIYIIFVLFLFFWAGGGGAKYSAKPDHSASHYRSQPGELLNSIRIVM